MKTSKTLRGDQRGAALILMMLAVIVATSTVLLVNLNGDDLRTRQLSETRAVLALARESLVEYALVNPDVNPTRAHSLPCPDIDETGGFADGEAHTSACGAPGVTVIGRLPWRTLGIPALKDSASACLWYVVSGSYKDAAANTSALVNSDSNGQLQLLDIETGLIIEGNVAADRPVAMVIAAMRPLAGQSRPGFDASRQCTPGVNAAAYLDADSTSGISNALLSGSADSLDVLGIAPGTNSFHNDRIATILRSDIERRAVARPARVAQIRELGLAVAACVANYGNNNPGGVNDERLPWPAMVGLSDYRPENAYDDGNTGFYSGRLADIVDDSNSATGNAVARILSDCDAIAVPQWTAQMDAAWRNWKDHFFYAVSDAFSPAATVPTSCGSCLTVNGSGQYAAILIFANSRLPVLSQVRDAPPIDVDNKATPSNYLEGSNAVNVPGAATADYVSGPASPTFNDLLFCIDDQLLVTEC